MTGRRESWFVEKAVRVRARGRMRSFWISDARSDDASTGMVVAGLCVRVSERRQWARGDWMTTKPDRKSEEGKIGWVLLWLLGVPIPILLVLFLLRGCT
jgi:hypothetical protein